MVDRIKGDVLGQMAAIGRTVWRKPSLFAENFQMSVNIWFDILKVYLVLQFYL